ncbi:hypothetical protein YPPY11_4932, partial [Yersinia pestis PY-11]
MRLATACTAERNHFGF